MIIIKINTTCAKSKQELWDAITGMKTACVVYNEYTDLMSSGRVMSVPAQLITFKH